MRVVNVDEVFHRPIWTLLRTLVARDLRIRYKVTVLGFFWSLLRPILMAGILWVVAKFLRFSPYYNVEFGVFLITGLLPWTFLATAVTDASNSFISNAALIRKVYFPRVVFPVVSILSNLVNFLLGLVVIFGALALFGKIAVGPRLLLLPVIILVQLILVTGLSLIFSVGNVFFRDVGMLLEFILQAWFYLTPIFYPVTFVVMALDKYSSGQIIYWYALLNPMTPLCYAYRWSLLSGKGLAQPAPPFPDSVWPWLLFAAAAISGVLLAIGAGVYRRLEGRIADEV